MNDIVAKLRHHYCVDGTPAEHPIRRAIAEILRLREEAEKMRQIAVEARRDADAAKRQRKRLHMLHGALTVSLDAMCRMSSQHCAATGAKICSDAELQEAIDVAGNALTIMDDDAIEALGESK